MKRLEIVHPGGNGDASFDAQPVSIGAQTLAYHHHNIGTVRSIGPLAPIKHPSAQLFALIIEVSGSGMRLAGHKRQLP
jgi:hypothetical protein